jgi:hypothetical protein
MTAMNFFSMRLKRRDRGIGIMSVMIGAVAGQERVWLSPPLIRLNSESGGINE